MNPGLTRIWQNRGLGARLLWPLSLVYCSLNWLRSRLFQAGWLRVHRLPVPVIVVGNVIAGGAGKTPLVMTLVRHLQEKGWRPGVVSRGYGRQAGPGLEVHAHLTARQCGDEPLLIKQGTGAPVFVNDDRVEAARALMRAHPQVNLIVADDGLQHHRLGRTINIAVFDERGLGNGWLLPAGPLRESWPRWTGAGSAIAPIHLVVTATALPTVAGLRCTRHLGSHAWAADGASVSLETLRSCRLQALAGIARPEAFFEMLEQRGLALERRLGFADHHEFQLSDVPNDAQLTLLMTEKDAVKIMPWAGQLKTRLLAVPLQINPDPGLFQAIEQLLERDGAAHHPIPSHHG
ncbi:MAG: tetraacyldisaccharide 4'-kinase [Betaproteobacteria bacterium]